MNEPYLCPLCKEWQDGLHDCPGVSEESLDTINQRYRALHPDELVQLKSPQPLLIASTMNASKLLSRCFYCSHNFTDGEKVYLCEWVEDGLEKKAPLCFDCVNFISTGETYRVINEQR